MTYAEAVLDNLKNCRTVALLHPRLAVVGVASELEILFREMFPPDVMDRWTKDFRQRNPKHPFPQTAAIREKLYGQSRESVFSEGLRKLLSSILRRADECRHTRVGVTLREAEHTIDEASEFINRLRQLESKRVLRCAKDSHVSFRYADVLDGALGATIKLRCPKCHGVIATHVIANPSEASQAFEARAGTPVARAKTMAVFGNEIRKSIRMAYADDDISMSELKLRQQLLAILVEPSEKK